MHCCSPSWKQRKFLQTNILERLKNHSENATTGEQHRGRQRSDSADPHAVGFPKAKITFSSIRKTHTGTTLSVCVFLFAIFLKNYLTNRKTYAIIKVLCEFFTVRGVTQLGRVLALGARCRRFESCRLDHIVPNILSNPSAGCFFVLQFFDKNHAIFSFFCWIVWKLLLTKTKHKNHLVLKSSASVFKKQGKSKKIAWHFCKAVI